MTERDRVHGAVISWDVGGKGFGFLRPDGHNELRDVFYLARQDLGAGVHNLTAGERVTFLMIKNDRGFRASDIKIEQEINYEMPMADRTEKRNMR